jgi:putative flippase GtrA
LPPDEYSATEASIGSRLARLIPAAARRIVIYGCVGVAVSMFYSVAVIACVALLHPISPTLASVIAFVISVPVAYLAHANLSFSDRTYDRFQPLRFAFSTAASFVVSIGGMYWITEIAAHSYLFGVAWNWVTIPVMNFLSYMFWVFRTARGAKGAARSESSTVKP